MNVLIVSQLPRPTDNIAQRCPVILFEFVHLVNLTQTLNSLCICEAEKKAVLTVLLIHELTLHSMGLQAHDTGLCPEEPAQHNN